MGREAGLFTSAVRSEQYGYVATIKGYVVAIDQHQPQIGLRG
jgi:hypothetical protein